MKHDRYCCVPIRLGVEIMRISFEQVSRTWGLTECFQNLVSNFKRQTSKIHAMIPVYRCSARCDPDSRSQGWKCAHPRRFSCVKSYVEKKAWIHRSTTHTAHFVQYTVLVGSTVLEPPLESYCSFVVSSASVCPKISSLRVSGEGGRGLLFVP